MKYQPLVQKTFDFEAGEREPSGNQDSSAGAQHISHTLRDFPDRLQTKQSSLPGQFNIEPELASLNICARADYKQQPDQPLSDADLKKKFDVFEYQRKSLFELRPEGRPLSELFEPTERRDQVNEYLRRHEVVFNSRKPPGLRTLTSTAEKIAQLEHLRGVAYHYPYQVMNVLFRRLPSMQYHARNFNDSISATSAMAEVFKWYCEFPHIRMEVKFWLNSAIRDLSYAQEVAAKTNRSPRIGKIRVQALQYLVPRIRAFDPQVDGALV